MDKDKKDFKMCIEVSECRSDKNINDGDEEKFKDYGEEEEDDEEQGYVR
mgnify:CR=1 FL=1